MCMRHEEYRLPSYSFLANLKSAGIDSVKALKMMKDKNAISDDVIVMYDEMYLQQCEEYAAGKVEGSNDDGELYNGVLAFMVIGLQKNVPFIVRAVTKTKLTAEMIKEELEKTLDVVMEAGFNVSLFMKFVDGLIHF